MPIEKVPDFLYEGPRDLESLEILQQDREDEEVKEAKKQKESFCSASG